MKILCISSSNVTGRDENSASTRVCQLAREQLQGQLDQKTQVEIISLADYDLQPCIMCGACAKDGLCIYDPAFNEIKAKMVDAQGMVVVSPLYASIPSKLVMVLEKLEEQAYILYVENHRNQTKDKFALADTPVAIIGHGGMAENYKDFYKKSLLDPIGFALSSIQMKVVGIDDEQPNGVVFGVSGMRMIPGEIFPEMEHNWEEIDATIKPLLNKLIASLQNNQ